MGFYGAFPSQPTYRGSDTIQPTRAYSAERTVPGSGNVFIDLTVLFQAGLSGTVINMTGKVVLAIGYQAASDNDGEVTINSGVPTPTLMRPGAG